MLPHCRRVILSEAYCARRRIVQPQYVLRIELVALLEHVDDRLLPFHVFIDKDKRGGFSGGLKTSVRQSFPAVELGVQAVKVLLLDEEDVEGLRTAMRHQGQYDNHLLAESDVLLFRSIFQLAVVRGNDYSYRGIFAPLLRMQLQGCVVSIRLNHSIYFFIFQELVLHH